MRRYVKDERLSLGEGDYGKDINGVWYARPPGMHTGCLSRHEVIEHDDGTITVTPSILVSGTNTKDEPAKWHGYLTKGEWSEC